MRCLLQHNFLLSKPSESPDAHENVYLHSKIKIWQPWRVFFYIFSHSLLLFLARFLYWIFIRLENVEISILYFFSFLTHAIWYVNIHFAGKPRATHLSLLPRIPTLHINVRLHFLEIEPSYPYNVKTRCFQWVSSLLYIAARGAPSTYDRAGRYARPHTSQTQVLRTGVLTGLPAV